MKYRWLDSEKPVLYRGRRNPTLRDRPLRFRKVPTTLVGGKRESGRRWGHQSRHAATASGDKAPQRPVIVEHR